VLLIQCNDYLAVTVALELVTSITDELLANAVGIIELAVDNSMDMVFTVVEWLRTGRTKIVYGEADVSKN
jgi:hypothetical protein